MFIEHIVTTSCPRYWAKAGYKTKSLPAWSWQSWHTAPKHSRCLSSKSMSKWDTCSPSPLCPVTKGWLHHGFPQCGLHKHTHSGTHSPIIIIGLSNARVRKYLGLVKVIKKENVPNPWALEKNDGSFSVWMTVGLWEGLHVSQTLSTRKDNQRGYSAWQSPFLTVRGATSLEGSWMGCTRGDRTIVYPG